jgi:glucosamine 6-phosphate synthetase-like amidotransferase/phosphosugar isomerase protein
MGPSNIGMLAELRQAPEAVRRQEQALARPIAELVRWCQRTPPRVVLTCARGSSAHAATFGKHLIERRLGVPVGAAAPNIATLYRRRLALKGQLLLTVSQSGRSEDLIEFTTMAKSAGAGCDRQRQRQSAGGGVRHPAADGGGARGQRGRDQDVRRDLRRSFAPHRCVDG